MSMIWAIEEAKGKKRKQCKNRHVYKSHPGSYKVIFRHYDDRDEEKGKTSYHRSRIPCFPLWGRTKSLASPILRQLGER